jgi:hypothetical protein
MRASGISPGRLATVIVAGAFCLSCKSEPPQPVQRESLETITATVEEIYLPTRMIVLRGDQNVMAAVIVGPDVRNLEQLRPGDRVTVSYYTALAAALKKPGDEDGVVQEEVRAPPGQRPGGAVGQSITTTVAIEAIDNSFGTVSFRRQDGVVRTVAIETPEGREFIKKLRPGDQVQVTYTEAVAVDVKPAS